jgi:hypothetical protein
MKNVDFEG